MHTEKTTKCRELVQQVYEQFDASHDFEHIERVIANARAIMQHEQPVQTETLLLAIYLHDVSDAKYATTNDTLVRVLNNLALASEQRAHVLHIIDAMSFNGGHEIEANTIEAKIARDADRLDALGAIGIARTFTFGGVKKRKLYDDEETARTYSSSEAYHAANSSTVTHFYEKLLTLRDKMCTAAGKQIEHERHAFMEQFLAQLAKEREGLG